MAVDVEAVVSLRHRILDLKDEVLALVPDVATIDPEAARSIVKARAALFEAWTILVGPPEEDDEDH